MTIFKQAINFIKDTEAVLMQAQKKLSFAFYFFIYFSFKHYSEQIKVATRTGLKSKT